MSYKDFQFVYTNFNIIYSPKYPLLELLLKNKQNKNKDGIWPISIYGSSTGWPPIQVKRKKSPTKNQKNNLLNCLKLKPLNLLLWRCGKTNKINILANKAITPLIYLG